MNIAISFPMLGDWTINPSNTYTIFGFTFYWYGVILAFALIVAVLFAIKICKNFGITSDNIIDMMLVATPSAIVGGRLYFVIFNFSNYKDDLLSILYVWQGGIAMYGVLIGGIAALVIFCRVKKIPPLAMLDVAAPSLLLAQCIGRWSNFINREAHGVTTDIFCRMGLTNLTTGTTTYVHPTFLYESLWNLLGFILITLFAKKGKRQYDGQLFVMYAGWYGCGRLMIEGLRTDSLFIGSTGIRVSQLIGGISLLAAIFILVFIRLRYVCNEDDLWVNRKAKLAFAGDAIVVDGEVSELVTDISESDTKEADVPEPDVLQPEEDTPEPDAEPQESANLEPQEEKPSANND